MTVLEKRPGLQPHSEFETEFGEAELSVERTDITFHDVAGDKVRIQVTVCNRGTRYSAPSPMRLESAPLGAFVPWKPLAQLVVPALEPGESREMSIEVPRPRPTPLGEFDRVPPKNLLTAVNAAEESPKELRQSFNSRLADAMRWRQKLFSARAAAAGKTSLAQDLWDLSGRGQPHWAGNINVFIGRKPVERHLSRALRIYPGRTNMAMFVVGEAGKREAYSFELAGSSSNWKTVLYETTHNKNLLADPSDAPIKETQWVEAAGSLMVMLATHPPVDCKAGKVEVHVTRRSSGDSAIVEFDLDPAAQGTGCYYV